MNPLEMSPISRLSTTSSSMKSNSRTLGSGSSLGNKENPSAIDTKTGICNLSVGGQKMKKSRKACGYNLRKSIAWNKAFFTEEGVLDPVELSMISGISIADSSPVVDEQRRDSLIVTPDVDTSSAEETRKEKFDKELLSGRPNKINKSSSLLKQDSSPGDHLPMLSRPSQKIPIGRGLHTSASKVASCVTPRTPSQKRLLTGTPKVVTRTSKIPRIPLSKHPPLPFTACIHAPSDGNHLQRNEIAQPAQKRAGLKLPSNVKPATKDANIRLRGTYNPCSGTNGLDRTCSSLEMGSTGIHKAHNTNKVNFHIQNNSMENISTIDETSKIKISSQHQFFNGDGIKKDVQAQGIKPSGLRMPSPSMKFFSEGYMKSSNHKVTILTSRKSKAADHISEFKQIKERHGSLCHDAPSRERLSSQVTEICSASSLIDPAMHVGAMYGKCCQQKVQPCILPGDKLPKPINKTKCTGNILNDFDNQHNNHDAKPQNRLSSQVTKKSAASSLVDPTSHANAMNEKSHQQKVQLQVLLGDKVLQPINNVKHTKNSQHNIDNQHSDEILSPLKDEGKDAKCNLILSHAESVNVNCNNPVSRPNGHSGGNMMNAACPEGQLTVDSTTNVEACSAFDEETCCSSPTMKDWDLVESVTVLNSHYNNHPLVADAPDGDPSTSMLYEDKTPGERKIDDSEHSYVKRSVKLRVERNKLLANDNCPLEIDGSGLAESVCLGGTVEVENSDVEKQGTITDCEQIVNTLASNAVPFSDEWLAALESAGEDILTKKTGAVQHSPPDKSVPEPGPWSPVKRKNSQMIGPFDCTKCTNTQPDQS